MIYLDLIHIKSILKLKILFYFCFKQNDKIYYTFNREKKKDMQF